jgi:hypothetical protein
MKEKPWEPKPTKKSAKGTKRGRGRKKTEKK